MSLRFMLGPCADCGHNDQLAPFADDGAFICIRCARERTREPSKAVQEAAREAGEQLRMFK